MLGEETAFFNPKINTKTAWVCPTGPFFPPIQEGLKVEEFRSENYLMHLPSDDHSHWNSALKHTWRALGKQGNSHGTPMGSAPSCFRHVHLKSKYHNCLTPIPEGSPLRDSSMKEKRGQEKASERISPQYQGVFARDYANLIEDTYRLSCRALPGDEPGIEEETLHNWDNIGHNMEELCIQEDGNMSEKTATSLAQKRGKKMRVAEMKDEQNELVGGADISFYCNDQSRVFMEKTQLVNSRSSNLRGLLEGPYFQADGHGPSKGHASWGPDLSKIMGDDWICKDEANGRHELLNNSVQTVCNVNTELTENMPARSGTWDAMNSTKVTGNGTYEQQPVLGEESVARGQGEGERAMRKLDRGFSRKEAVSKNTSNYNVDGEVSMALEDNLDVKANNVVAYAPLDLSKDFSFSKQPDNVSIDVQKSLLDMGSLGGCSKEEDIYVTGAGRRISHDGQLSPVDFKVPSKSISKYVSEQQQSAASCPSSIVTKRKSYMLPLSIDSEFKSVDSSQRTSIPQHLSLATQQKTTSDLQASGATVPSFDLTTPQCVRETVVASKWPVRTITDSSVASAVSLHGRRPHVIAGTKRCSILPTLPSQKQAQCSKDDTLLLSKRKRVDSASRNISRGLTVPAGVTQGLRRNTNGLKGLKPKPDNPGFTESAATRRN
ncbi:hypothetical protein AGOR_G00019080 [Albula goreensis]|uniref:Uncharacterized protein n=1 Tax=Albula goreensis TaxID=1534307 RepID=A0A8T3E386_9TELE|nr:hypothetical protein AGOR_G00019080 [Albula goreensis]